MFNIGSWWNSRLERWLNNRIPDDRKFQMNMSNVFIFPSKFGIAFCLLCGLLFILGTNYRNNLMLLLAYFLLAIFLVTLLNSYANFARLKVQLGKVKPAYAGSECALPLWLGENDKNNAAVMNCHGRLHFRLWQQSVQYTVESELHSNPVVINVETLRRGYFTPPRITIESYYPIGLFRCWTHLRFKAQILVYPKPIPADLRTENIASEDEEGSEHNSATGNTDFDSLKTYVPGESLNRVAWKLVAKGQEMMTKQFADASHAAVWLDLRNYLRDDLELAISKLTWQAINLSQRQVCFGLRLGHVEVPPDTGNGHLESCLTELSLYQLADSGKT